MNAKQLARLNALAEADRAGYPGPVGRVVSTPIIGADGQPQRWGHNPEHPGPLDGQVRMNHAAVFTYPDGYSVSIEPGGTRKGAWRGGKDNT